MKIIDRTPFVSEDGQITFTDRIRGMMKFGYSWFSQIEAQQKVINLLDKHLGNRYIVFRNHTLPRSEIMIPLILIGPVGLFVINVTDLRGIYQAKGENWDILEGEKLRPANVNLLARTARFAKATQIYFQRQGYENIGAVEPILICADPGLHVDSVRPAVRVVMSDAIERFAASLIQARQILSPELARELSDRLLKPRSKKIKPEPIAANPEIIEETPSADQYSGGYAAEQPEQEWNPEMYGFAFDDTVETETPRQGSEPDQEMSLLETQRSASLFGEETFEESPDVSQYIPKKRGMSKKQWWLLGAMGFVEILVLIAFAVIIFISLR